MNKADLIMNAGRILPDAELDLNTLCESYKRKVLDLVTLMQNKTVVLDYDGTLTEFKYAKDRLLPCKDDELCEYAKEHNLYENVNCLKTMQYILQFVNPQDIWVVTVSVDAIRGNKNNAIKKDFCEIPTEHIIHCKSSLMKTDILNEIHQKTGKKIVFVEDTSKTILNAEEALDFVHGVHISSLIP